MSMLKKAGGTTVVMGIVLMVLGLIALASPLQTGIGVAILVGAVLLLGGVYMAITAWRGKAFGAAIGDFLWALLYVIVGLFVVLHPLVGLAFMTLLLAFFFFVAGIWKVGVAWRHRPRSGWGLLMASGVVSLVLGLMILTSWPVSGTWAVGTLVGIELLFDGWSLMTLGSTVREVGKAIEGQA